MKRRTKKKSFETQIEKKRIQMIPLFVHCTQDRNMRIHRQRPLPHLNNPHNSLFHILPVDSSRKCRASGNKQGEPQNIHPDWLGVISHNRDYNTTTDWEHHLYSQHELQWSKRKEEGDTSWGKRRRMRWAAKVILKEEKFSTIRVNGSSVESHNTYFS